MLFRSRGTWKEHIEYMGEKYKDVFDIMLKNIEKHMPSEVDFIYPQGGVNFWFRLPKGISSKNLYETAIKNNVAIAPGNLFFVHQNDDRHFRLSIASVNDDEIEHGIIIISNIIKNLIKEKNDSETREEIYKPIL